MIHNNDYPAILFQIVVDLFPFRVRIVIEHILYSCAEFRNSMKLLNISFLVSFSSFVPLFLYFIVILITLILHAYLLSNVYMFLYFIPCTLHVHK
jgi:hypothetical protein